MGNNVQELLDMLYSMVKEAWGLPLSSEKCVLERDKVVDLIDSIKSQLPTEIAEAKRLVDARAEFIANAKREAETIRHAAEERAKQLVNENEIYKAAKAKSTELLTTTEKATTELKKAANDYVDDTLRRTEEAISKALDETRRSRASFRSLMNSAAKADGESIDVPVDEE